MRWTKFSKFASFVLGYNLLVIVWGAIVRHTFSGDGCGSHWPLCNGEILPIGASTKTLVEFSHRVSSGLSLVFVVILAVWAFRAFSKGHGARKAATFAVVFTCISALIGAGLVLLRWVGYDDSAGRAITLAAHLINTMLLLAALFLTAWTGSGGRMPQLRDSGGAGWLVAIGAGAVLLVGVSGAVTSLGDTLFPRTSSLQVVHEGLSLSGHFLLRLRLWHPVIAIASSLYLLFMAGLLSDLRRSPAVRKAALALAGLVLSQVLLGWASVQLKAPTSLALVHLVLADLLWLGLVLLAALTLVPERQTSEDIPKAQIAPAN